MQGVRVLSVGSHTVHLAWSGKTYSILIDKDYCLGCVLAMDYFIHYKTTTKKSNVSGAYSPLLHTLSLSTCLRLGDSVSRGYSVHVGMDVEAGELLAVYKWILQAGKSLYAKRNKQVISIQQEFESIIKQGIHHPGLLQHLDMTHSSLRGEADAKIFVEVRREGGCVHVWENVLALYM